MADNYYKDQLNKINFNSDFRPKLKVTDSDGNETKWMDLNAESITTILEWLNVKIQEVLSPTEKIEKKDIEFERIDNDINGNPRYVVHYLDLLSEKDRQNVPYDKRYELALKRGRKLGGKKYNTKKYAGGIVFQSYNTDSLADSIKKMLIENETKPLSGSKKNSTESILEKIAETKTIDEKTLKLLLKRKNAGEKFNDAPIWDGEIELTKDQQAKGLKFLKNLWKSPTGKERKTNPFGSREESILENFSTMYLRGFYDAGNASHSFWVPLYQVAGDGTTMEYYVSGGKVHIVG